MQGHEINFTIRISSHCLVITPQGSLSLAGIDAMCQSALDQLAQETVQGMILDLAGVPIIDGAEFQALLKLLSMGTLMGAKQMMVGIHAGIASALVETQIDFSGISFAHTLDDALNLNMNLNQ